MQTEQIQLTYELGGEKLTISSSGRDLIPTLNVLAKQGAENITVKDVTVCVTAEPERKRLYTVKYHDGNHPQVVRMRASRFASVVSHIDRIGGVVTDVIVD